jgi:hypothetical protein
MTHKRNRARKDITARKPAPDKEFQASAGPMQLEVTRWYKRAKGRQDPHCEAMPLKSLLTQDASLILHRAQAVLLRLAGNE